MGNVWDEGRWKTTELAAFDFTARHIFERMRRYLDPSGLRFLELGAGTGQLSYLWLEAGAAHVTLVDNSPKAITMMRGLFQDIDPSRYEIVEAGALEYSTDDRFDLVFSSGLIEHFQGEQRFEIVAKHVKCSAQHVFIVHPSDRLYNRLFDRTPMARKRYGFAQTYSIEELDGIAHSYLSGGGQSGLCGRSGQGNALEEGVVPTSSTKSTSSTTCQPGARPSFLEHERFHLFYTVPGLHNWGGLCRACDATPLPRLLGGLVLSRCRDNRASLVAR